MLSVVVTSFNIIFFIIHIHIYIHNLCVFVSEACIVIVFFNTHTQHTLLLQEVHFTITIFHSSSEKSGSSVITNTFHLCLVQMLPLIH